MSLECSICSTEILPKEYTYSTKKFGKPLCRDNQLNNGIDSKESINTTVSQQIRSFAALAKAKKFKVIKSLLNAPEFSDEFINDTELEYDLHLSLIKADSLIKILEGFRKSKKLKQFPYKLLMRDVLIQEDRIIKAIGK